MTEAIRQHKKLNNALKQWLLGRNYNFALRSLGFAKKYHWEKDGVIRLRKDGSTPEFYHQIEISLYVATLEPYLIYKEETLCAAILHDLFEDYDVEWNDLYKVFSGAPIEFIERVIEACKTLTKVYKGVKMNPKEYFYNIGLNPIASIVKGADRINNQNSMNGVFTYEKQLSYIKETDDGILPAIKAAEDDFPEQKMAYESIKFVLKSQKKWITKVEVK